MFTRLLPTGVPEILLFLVFVTVLFLSVRAIMRRRSVVLPPAMSDAEMPNLETQQRVSGAIRRVFRDPAQKVNLVEIAVGARRLIFCPTDWERNSARYAAGVGEVADIALFALATLAPGGVESMRDLIKNADKANLKPDMVTLTHEGEFPNDYVVIGRILDHRAERWDELEMTAYRTQVLRGSDLTLVLDLAVPRANTPEPLPSQSLAHGSARLFGYLAA